jgi:predicted lipid-binding transport protein (Tim44 family)
MGSEIPLEPSREAALTIRLSLATALIGGALVAGCGDDDQGSSAAPASTATTTPDAGAAKAVVAEIAAVRKLLDQAVNAYEKGDARTAERLAGDGYLEHFEEVEHPLEERDRELMEKLEKALATTLRDEIKAGAPPSDVKRFVGLINDDLDRAEAALP